MNGKTQKELLTEQRRLWRDMQTFAKDLFDAANKKAGDSWRSKSVGTGCMFGDWGVVIECTVQEPGVEEYRLFVIDDKGILRTHPASYSGDPNDGYCELTDAHD